MRAVLRGGRQAIHIPREAGARKPLLNCAKASFWDVLMDLAAAGEIQYLHYSYKDRADCYRLDMPLAAAEKLRAAERGVEVLELAGADPVGGVRVGGFVCRAVTGIQAALTSLPIFSTNIRANPAIAGFSCVAYAAIRGSAACSASRSSFTQAGGGMRLFPTALANWRMRTGSVVMAKPTNMSRISAVSFALAEGSISKMKGNAGRAAEAIWMW